MIRIQKRNTSFHIDCQIGPDRFRGALGTKDKTVASRLKSRIELALAEGARSENWIDLKRSLPSTTYARFAKATGLKVEAAPTWGSVVSIFWTDCGQRVRLGKMAPNTLKRYEYALDCFRDYLEANYQGPDTYLADLTPFVIEDYQVQRLEQILEKPNSKGGNGLAVEVSVLHSVFQMAVDRHMISKNPVRKGHTKSESEVNPFTGDELKSLMNGCETDEDWVVYNVLRHTGLRVSDAVDLKWGNVRGYEIRKRTIKRGVIVHVPLAFPLVTLFATLGQRPSTEHVILVNKKPATTAQIRSIVRQIGVRAGVKATTPHRFRHSMAVDLLLKGASTFEVAKTLGDSVATVEKHYLKYLPAMRDKVKQLLNDTSKGLEAI